MKKETQTGALARALREIREQASMEVFMKIDNSLYTINTEGYLEEVKKLPASYGTVKASQLVAY